MCFPPLVNSFGSDKLIKILYRFGHSSFDTIDDSCKVGRHSNGTKSEGAHSEEGRAGPLEVGDTGRSRT